jgi:transposase InsO family protein
MFSSFFTYLTYLTDLYELFVGIPQNLPPQILSRKGVCHDNAVVESFFSSLKTELVDD